MKQKIKKSFDIYDAGLYLRLSRDDADEDGTKTESNSIANQRELLRNFVKRHRIWKSKLRNCKGFVQIWKRVY